MIDPSSKLRRIPAVGKVLRELNPTALPNATVVSIVRRELGDLKKRECIPDHGEIIAGIQKVLIDRARSRIQPLINGTGVILHTNLGRAPLCGEAVEALVRIASDYSNLEYDLSNGCRGQRGGYVEYNLALLCGADAAMTVNNCAAALVLILRHLTGRDRKEVIVSRGQLIQIGGGFRIPEILEACGARLREVGTTNKTAADDYARAISQNTAVILNVHQSNFCMSGFVGAPSTQEIAALARAKRIPFVEDLGSGAVIPTEKCGVPEHEPTPAEILQRGADLVCFSGDKLFGGPQAGIIAGRSKLITALRKDPLFRALRCDKLVLSAMQATVDAYLNGTARESVPTLKTLGTSQDQLFDRAQKIVEAIQGAQITARVGTADSQVGGGTMPKSIIPSVTVNLVPKALSLTEFAALLREGIPPIVGYSADGFFKLDMRTIFPRQDTELIRQLRSILSEPMLQ